MVKLSKNVSNTHSMNLEAFTVGYSPKLQILFFKFEIWYDWLKLAILFKNSKNQKFQRTDHHYFLKIVSFIALEQY